MLGFFPNPYPDELLYSILARYYLWSANRSPKVTLQELFGKNTVIATFDLPSNIESLVQHLPRLSKYTADSFIQENTLYSFYVPFCPPNRAKALYQSMRQHFSGDIHSRIGIMASSIPIPKYFKFCPICIHKDNREYGEIYWHRTHQIIGVLVCPKHKVWLQESSVKTKGNNRHKFIAADWNNCLLKPSSVSYTKSTLNKLTILAQDIFTVLNSNFPSRSGNWYRNQYQSLLSDRGLSIASGRVHQKDLIREFVDFYGEEFLGLIYSKINTEIESNWLSSIVRKHRKIFHPLRHLLLIRFLGKEVSDFFTLRINQNPFGKGLWTCFNGASEHYLKKIIKSVSISYSNDMKKLVGTFSCSCGFIYSTSDISVPYSKRLSCGKIKAYGYLWENKLKSLFSNKSLSLRETARQLKVDPKTVLSHAKRLQLIPDNSKAITKVKIKIENEDESKNKNRNKWLNAQKKYPKLSKNELRRLYSSVYMRLYRNDRIWLDSNSPKSQQNPTVNKRVDWKERDERILELSRISYKKLLDEVRPVRITISRIGKEIDQSALLEKHLSKLPQTGAYVESIIETIEDFQMRRIRWAIAKLINEDEFPKPWKICRIAGLKSDAAKKLNSYIEQEIRDSVQISRKRSVS